MLLENKIILESVKYLNKNSVVIDIGAYIGYVSKDLFRYVKGADPKNYYLIEACKKNFSVLEKNCSSFRLFNCAISDKTGKQEFYIGDHSGSQGTSQANSLFAEFIGNKKWNKQLTSYEVDTFTLDDFLANNNISHVDYLKINCEGGEYKIFDSSLDFLDITSCINLQIHGKDPVFLTEEMRNKKQWINNMLIERNFKCVMGTEPDTVADVDTHTLQLWVKE